MGQDLWNKFKEASVKFGDQTAIQYKQDGEWSDFSFSDLRNNIESLSVFLTRQNVKRGDTVTILMENRPEWPMVFFAVLSIGAVVIPINPGIGREETRNILASVGCKIAFVGKDSFLLEEGVVLFIEKVISVESDLFKAALEKEPRKIEDADIGEDHTACILHTSGTTAEPKGVMLTHGNLLSNSDSTFRLGLMRQADGIMAVLPLYDAYPLTTTMLLPLFYGGRIIYPGSMNPEDVLTAMREKDPANFIGVPQIFNLFHRQIVEGLAKIPFPLGFLVRAAAELLYGFRNVTGVNLSRYLFYGAHRQLGRSMKVFISGGAKFDENVGKNLFKFGFTVLEGYGLTETSPLLTLNPLGKPKIGSVGVPVPDVELKLLNMNEEGAGEIVARGPNIMKGYYKRDDLTDDVIKDGWFHTGDIGSIDKDGYLFLKGRSKDMIVLDSGLNVYPKEIEEEYSRAAPIKEMCVYEAYPQRGRPAQVLWAVVVPDPGFSREHGGEVKAIKDALKKRFEKISEKLSEHKRISDFFVTFESLPRTVSGKVKRYAIREIYSKNYYEGNCHDKME